jgi:hypothetical protein
MNLHKFIESLTDNTSVAIDKTHNQQICQTITYNGKTVGNYILSFDKSEEIISGTLSTPHSYYVYNIDIEDGIFVDTLDDFIIKINQMSATGDCDNLVTIFLDIDPETMKLIIESANKEKITVEEFIINSIKSFIQE